MGKNHSGSKNRNRRSHANFMNSLKVPFPLPWREGMKGRLYSTIQAIINGPGRDTAKTFDFHPTAVFTHGDATPLAEGEKISGSAKFTALHQIMPSGFLSLLF
jgi:hypothetical protein